MSGTKLKMTGFARFFIAMLIIAPLSFLGASYYNGQDGIQNLKELLGLGGETTHVESRESTPTTTKPILEASYFNLFLKTLFLLF